MIAAAWFAAGFLAGMVTTGGIVYYALRQYDAGAMSGPMDYRD